MDIVVTLAGHSRRFKEAGYNLPKFLIEIDGKPMIEHVVGMFGSDDSYHFVLTDVQLSEYPQIEDILRRIVKKCNIVVIKPHESGPAYSAMQVKGIQKDSPVIISYCDFFVQWEYKKFLRQVYSYDGAIPSFCGFHPASFGHTYYAYMRVNENNEMLELREKNSFTPSRHEEFASAGIYYFKSWDIFLYYVNYIMEHGFDNLKEGYVSLLFNPMVKDGLKVLVTEVEKFVCWGTPDDLLHYQMWSRYFQPSSLQSIPGDSPELKQINLIPMAGRGSRFKSSGYRTSKPLIIVKNRPMVITACTSFLSAQKWVFLPRAEDLEKHPIEVTIRNFLPDSVIVPVEGDTSGQAATCLLAKEHINPEIALLIASCDYETIFDQEKWQQILLDTSIDAVIWTYRLGSNLAKNPKAFAYCKTVPDSNVVTAIVEKNLISDKPWLDPLVVGTFWFRRASDFIWSAETAIANNIHVNGEHYVANSMNLLLQSGKKIVIFDIEQWISYGDPFELQLFEYWEDFFLEENTGRAVNV